MIVFSNLALFICVIEMIHADFVQLRITLFFNEGFRIVRPFKEELILDGTNKRNLERFICHVLRETTKNSIVFKRISSVASDVLESLERRHRCYFKHLSNGMVKVSKRAVCEGGLKYWKICPEKRCLNQYCGEIGCPHIPGSEEALAELTFENV